MVYLRRVRRAVLAEAAGDELAARDVEAEHCAERGVVNARKEEDDDQRHRDGVVRAAREGPQDRRGEEEEERRDEVDERRLVLLGDDVEAADERALGPAQREAGRHHRDEHARPQAGEREAHHDDDDDRVEQLRAPDFALTA